MTKQNFILLLMVFVYLVFIFVVWSGNVDSVRPGVNNVLIDKTNSLNNLLLLRSKLYPTTTTTLSDYVVVVSGNVSFVLNVSKNVKSSFCVEFDKNLSRLRPTGESWAFQGGYFYGLDDVREMVGCPREKFHSAPSIGVQSLIVNKSLTMIVPVQSGNFIQFDMRNYRIEAVREKDGELNDGNCLNNWSDSFRYANYNISFYDNVSEENISFYNVSWSNVSYYNTRFKGVQWNETWRNLSYYNSTYFVRIYSKK